VFDHTIGALQVRWVAGLRTSVEHLLEEAIGCACLAEVDQILARDDEAGSVGVDHLENDLFAHARLQHPDHVVE
jgi:hypothetical protein